MTRTISVDIKRDSQPLTVNSTGSGSLALAAHIAEPNAHPQYTTLSTGSGSLALAAHIAEPNAHPQYTTLSKAIAMALIFG